MYGLLWFIVAITPIICSPQEPHQLLFNFNGEIKLSLINNLVEMTSFSKDLTYALDFIHNDSLICWIDNEREEIGCFVQNDGQQGDEIVYVKEVSANAIACDWITRKIYWTDTTSIRIEVISIETRYRAVVYRGDIVEPRGIALDPLKGLIFWSDRGSGMWGKIERGSMNGDASARKRIVDTDVIWPNGITLDIERRQIYWTDERNANVETANYDGGNRRIVVDRLIHPFKITRFQQALYFTDWERHSIQYYNLSKNAAKAEILLDAWERIADVKAYDASLQPYQKTGCERDNGGCAQLCLLSSTNRSGYSCHCETGVKLSDDKRSCSEDALLLAQPSAIHIIYPEDTALSRKLPLTNVGSVRHVDYDPVDKFVYWTDTDSGSIRRAKLDGSQQEEVIATSVKNPEGIAIDWVSRNVYWTEATLDRIEVCSLVKRVKKTIVFENVDNPKEIVVSPYDRMIFWSGGDSERMKIERAEVDGTDRLVLVRANIGWPNGLTVDQSKKKIYWGDAKLNKIEVVDFEGKNRKSVVEVDLLHSFSLTYLDNKLYWADSRLRSSLEGASTGEPPKKRRVPLAKDIREIMSVKAISTKMELSNSTCIPDNGQCSQLCFAISSNKPVCDCIADYMLDSDDKTCVQLEKYIVAVHSNEKIVRVSITPNTSQKAVPVPLHVKHITAIDVDNNEGALYWSDEAYKYIGRSNLNGSNSKIIIEGGLTAPESIAIDWISRNVYWADSKLGRIEVVTQDGAFRRTLMWKGLKEPRNLLVEPRIGRFFFSEYDIEACMISTARMDGTNKTKLVDNTNHVTGLAIDYKQRLFYWVHSVSYSSRIDSCNMDGRNCRVVYSTGSEKQFTLALDREFLYAGSPKDGTILRIHKSDYTQGRTINTGFKKSNGMKMVEQYETIGQNDCAISNGGCKYLCLVKPGTSDESTSTMCACPTHYTKNGSNCDPPMDFLVISQENALHRLTLNVDDCPDVPITIDGINDVKTIQYDAESDYFLWLDDSEIIRNSFNKSLDILGHITQHIYIYDVALDPISKLLFWTCSISDVVNATKLMDPSSTMIIFKGNGTQKPRRLAIHPERGEIFWSNNDIPPHVVHSKYDGSFLGKIDTNYRIVRGMFVDRRENKLYFSITNTIVQYDLKNKTYREIVSTDVNTMAKFVILDTYLYWLDKPEYFKIERALITHNRQLIDRTTIVEMSSQITDLIAVTVQDDKNHRHPCSKENHFGNCSHICMAVLSNPTLVECGCPLYHVLNKDKKACSEILPTTNNSDLFKCEAGNKHISIESTCDGTNDCTDGSDENLTGCVVATNKESDVTKNTSSTPQVSDSKDDKAKDSDYTINVGWVVVVCLLLIPCIVFFVGKYGCGSGDKADDEQEIAVMTPLPTSSTDEMMGQRNSIEEDDVDEDNNDDDDDDYHDYVPSNASVVSSMIHCPLNPPPSPSTTLMRQDDCDCNSSSYFQPSDGTMGGYNSDLCDESDATYRTDDTYLRRSSGHRSRSSGTGSSNNASTMSSSYRSRRRSMRNVDRSRRNKNMGYENVRRLIRPATPPAPTPSVCSSALHIDIDMMSDYAPALSPATPSLCSSSLTASWDVYDRRRHLSPPPAPTPSMCSSVPPSPPLSPYTPPPTPDHPSPFD